MKKNIYLLVYILLIFLNLYSTNYSNSLNFIVKPLLMPILMLYVFYYSKQQKLTLLASLFFAWLGDIFLLYSNITLFFTLGLASFLIAHLCYIYIFIQSFTNKPTDRLMNYVRTSIILLAIAFYTFIHKYFASLLIPSTIYMVVILIMFLSATFRDKKDSLSSYIYVVIGSLLFLLSDSSLAITKFYQQFYLGNTVIILTYMVAQLFIIIGLLKQAQVTSYE